MGADGWRRTREVAHRHPVAMLLFIGAASRLLVFLVATWSASRMTALPAGTWERGPAWVRPFVRWDSGYYADIADHGYGLKPELWAFHPGYPAVIASVRAILPGVSTEAIGFWVSQVAFLAGLPLFYILARDLFGPAVAWRASLAYVAFPGAFFLSAFYPESLFMLATLACLLALHRERWVAAMLGATVAAAVRPQGMFLLPIVPLGMWLAHRQGRRVSLVAWTALPLLLAFPLGFSWHAAALTGDPLRWIHAREAFWPNAGWHGPVFAFSQTLALTPSAYGFPLLGLAAVMAGVGFAAHDARTRTRPKAFPAYAYAAVLLGVYLFYAEPASLIRFALPVLPAFWALGTWSGRTRVFAAVLGVSAALQATVAALFATWHPPY